MLAFDNNQASFHSVLYNKIPQDHTLVLINENIDFSFINPLLETSYCKYYGRPAKEPELLIRISIIQYLYNLSDPEVIAEANLNIAYLYFLGINPEDDDKLPDPTTLCKFRNHRLQECSVDDILQEIARQCVDLGIIEGKSLTIDSTHVEAGTSQHTPERVMKKLAQNIQGTLEEEHGSIPEEINQEIPEVRDAEDYREAKTTMKSYLEEMMIQIETLGEMPQIPETKAMMDIAKDILQDPKFLQAKGTRSVIDRDARVGHKKKNHRFFGYKVEFTMTVPEYIITAVHVGNGSYVDGTMFEKLLERTKATGMTIEELLGDKAYFKKEILDRIQDIGATPYIPISEMAYRVDERFTYNKDSDEWFCEQGNKTVKKAHKKRKSSQKEALKYYFEKETCRSCPIRQECVERNRPRKILEVGANAPEFFEHKEFQKSDHFKETYKKRASQEWKNGEMKNFHGLGCARGYNQLSMSKQAKFTALAVNMKRIANLLSSSSDSHGRIITNLMDNNPKQKTSLTIAA
ncbi:IS1182 family transposase [Pontibacillus yanchengensis]|uniref:IS1182 family transposase n=1 Tax=Pontibacillus yanchengensis TaxID=462910 RepID=UPI001F01FFE6|nr:IS1182 family transposase [Pontibacillus yanchengensis]